MSLRVHESGTSGAVKAVMIWRRVEVEFCGGDAVGLSDWCVEVDEERFCVLKLEGVQTRRWTGRELVTYACFL